MTVFKVSAINTKKLESTTVGDVFHRSLLWEIKRRVRRGFHTGRSFVNIVV